MDALLQHTNVPEAAEYLIGIDVNSTPDAFNPLRSTRNSSEYFNTNTALSNLPTSIEAVPQTKIENNLTTSSSLTQSLNNLNEVSLKKKIKLYYVQEVKTTKENEHMDIDTSNMNLITKEIRTFEDLNSITEPNLKVSRIEILI